MNKKTNKSSLHNLLSFFHLGKKGMEMWQLVLMILAIILLVFIVAWYSGLNQSLGSLFGRLGDW